MIDLCKALSDLQEKTMRLYAGEFTDEETPVLPALVPTAELLPDTSECDDESDTRVQAD